MENLPFKSYGMKKPIANELEQEHIKGRSLQLCRTAFETLLIGFAHIWGGGIPSNVIH